MIKRFLVIGIILSLVFMSITPSFAFDNVKKSSKPIFNGNILYVGGNGTGNYTKIQDAINDAVDGDTVFVYDDNSPYYENIIIDKSINLIGENRNTTIIDGKNVGNVVTINDVNVTVQEFFIRNSGHDSYSSGILLNSGYSRIISNNIHNNNNGIHSNLSDHLISENSICNNNRDGIFMKWSFRNIIFNNIINNNSADGIFLGTNWQATYHILKENTICDNGGNGIYLGPSTGDILSENYINHNYEFGIYLFDCDKTTVYKNNIFNNWIGLKISPGGSKHNVSENNISYNNDGIWMNSENSKINNNIISGNTNNGLYIFSVKNIITGNTFSQNDIGLYLAPYSYNNIISDNIFFNDGFFIAATYQNTYTDNIINGKPFLYIVEEQDKTISGEFGQIVLVGCKNIDICNMNISDTTVAIQLIGCDNCRIFRNNICNNFYGIYVSGLMNKIYNNNIQNNKEGLFWHGVFNVIKKNNFIDNELDASFILKYGPIYFSLWYRNYWDGLEKNRMKISGKKEFRFDDPYNPGEYYYRYIRWIGFDRFPAKEPYDI